MKSQKIKLSSIPPGSVTVFIGPNGSGKSMLLRELCTNALRSGQHVLAVAPSIYDRFKYMPRTGFKFYGARQGSGAASKVIRDALMQTSTSSPVELNKLTRALEYTKFDPFIGISLSKIDFGNFAAAAEQLNSFEAGEIWDLLQKWDNQVGENQEVQLGMYSSSFRELENLSFAALARHEDWLRKTKTTRITYYLYRNGNPIPLLDACSGELTFITTVAFIASQIRLGSLIAIDEPETSLHPNWQQSYVSSLLDVFHYYEPRILICTHSPIIISAAERAESNLTTYEVDGGEVSRFDHTYFSLEEIYDRLFGLITPKNHYLSNLAVELLNSLNDKSNPYDFVVAELLELREKSYDRKQMEVIDGFLALAHKIAFGEQEQI